MVPRSDCTTISCWAAPRAIIRATRTTLVINAKTKYFANIGGITGSDEVWFNNGDNRYYLGASKMPSVGPNWASSTEPVC